MTDDLPLEIDVQTLHDMRQSDSPVAVLDVREPQELTICALPDTLQIPMNQVPQNIESLPRDGVLAVLCHSGMRSMQVTQWLRAQGFANAQNVAGGIDAWAQIIEPSMQRY